MNFGGKISYQRSGSNRLQHNFTAVPSCLAHISLWLFSTRVPRCVERESNPHSDQERRFELRAFTISPSTHSGVDDGCRSRTCSVTRSNATATTHPPYCTVSRRCLMHIRTIRLSKNFGGRCGIRTHGPVSRASVFETDTIDRSVNLPSLRREWDSNPCPSSSPRFRLANGLLKPLEHLSKTYRG